MKQHEKYKHYQKTFSCLFRMLVVFLMAKTKKRLYILYISSPFTQCTTMS